MSVGAPVPSATASPLVASMVSRARILLHELPGWQLLVIFIVSNTVLDLVFANLRPFPQKILGRRHHRDEKRKHSIGREGCSFRHLEEERLEQEESTYSDEYDDGKKDTDLEKEYEHQGGPGSYPRLQHLPHDASDSGSVCNKGQRGSSSSSYTSVVHGGGGAKQTYQKTRKRNWIKRLVPSLFGAVGKDDERIPPTWQLLEQVEVLTHRCEQAVAEKSAMEQEYEKSRWQLQETQTELSSLQSTTQYLKAQLREQQEMIDRVARSERRKAKEKLVHMKEAMVEVVERERQVMRDEFLRQAAEFQKMWKENQVGGDQGDNEVEEEM